MKTTKTEDLTTGRIEAPRPSLMRAMVVPVVVVSVILLLGFLLLDLVGLLPVPPTDSGEKTLAAALVLVGILVTGAVSLIGLVIKSSYDERTAQAQRAADDRNFAIAREAEQRNRIDTIVHAIGLLGANGQNGTIHQIGGALLALSNLGEHDLAVSLVANLWPENLVSRRAVAQIVRKAFKEGSQETQYAVAILLLENAAKLPGENRVYLWPVIDLGWPLKALLVCRIALIMAAVKSFIVQLQQSTKVVPGSAAVLFEALRDEDPQVKSMANSSLRVFAEAIDESEWIHTGTKIVTVKDIRRAIEPTAPASSLAAQYEAEVKALMEKKSDTVA